jgi:hypothetical protein
VINLFTSSYEHFVEKMWMYHFETARHMSKSDIYVLQCKCGKFNFDWYRVNESRVLRGCSDSKLLVFTQLMQKRGGEPPHAR